VPILLATSPLAATRSAPTMTRSMSPRASRLPAATSGNRVTGIPSRCSSQAVRRAPCSTGRVSSAYTRTRLPAATAERITPSAVPCPAVARAPALQWVRMRAPSGTSAAPCAPMRRFAAMSSEKISRALPVSASTIAPTSWPGTLRQQARIRSSAQNRFTAVGRLAARTRKPLSSSAEKSAGAAPRRRCASTAIPNAAAQPIAGAPRTARSRMASAVAVADARDR
jgi:hypothetical protein